MDYDFKMFNCVCTLAMKETVLNRVLYHRHLQDFNPIFLGITLLTTEDVYKMWNLIENKIYCRKLCCNPI